MAVSPQTAQHVLKTFGEVSDETAEMTTFLFHCILLVNKDLDYVFVDQSLKCSNVLVDWHN